jgi:hypothetical protein
VTLVEWYTARAGGLVAFGLLTLAVLAGLTLSGRAKLRYWPRFAVEDVHRFLGLLTAAFVALHVLALFVDGYMPFSLTQLVVPGAAAYRPFATALGIVAAELLRRARGHEPLSTPAFVPLLAPRALPELRRVVVRPRARAPRRLRYRIRVGDCVLRRRRRCRRRPARLAPARAAPGGRRGRQGCGGTTAP